VKPLAAIRSARAGLAWPQPEPIPQGPLERFTLVHRRRPPGYLLIAGAVAAQDVLPPPVGELRKSRMAVGRLRRRDVADIEAGDGRWLLRKHESRLRTALSHPPWRAHESPFAVLDDAGAELARGTHLFGGRMSRMTLSDDRTWRLRGPLETADRGDGWILTDDPGGHVLGTFTGDGGSLDAQVPARDAVLPAPLIALLGSYLAQWSYYPIV
jgi:hypothetical protein